MGEYYPHHPVIKNFWSVFSEFETSNKKKFLGELDSFLCLCECVSVCSSGVFLGCVGVWICLCMDGSVSVSLGVYGYVFVLLCTSYGVGMRMGGCCCVVCGCVRVCVDGFVSVCGCVQT